LMGGSWFEYEVTTERSDEAGSGFTEKYVAVSVEEDAIVFERYVDGKLRDTVEGSPSFAGLLFDLRGLSKLGTESIDTPFGPRDVTVYGSDRCGGGERVYVGAGGTVHRDIRTQLWSGGVVYTETRELKASSTVV